MRQTSRDDVIKFLLEVDEGQEFYSQNGSPNRVNNVRNLLRILVDMITILPAMPFKGQAQGAIYLRRIALRAHLVLKKSPQGFKREVSHNRRSFAEFGGP